MANEMIRRCASYQFSTSFPLPPCYDGTAIDESSSLVFAVPFNGRLALSFEEKFIARGFNNVFCRTLEPALKEVESRMASMPQLDEPSPGITLSDIRQTWTYQAFAKAYNTACIDSIFKPYHPSFQHLYRDIMDKYARFFPHDGSTLRLGPALGVPFLGTSEQSSLVQLCESCVGRQLQWSLTTTGAGDFEYPVGQITPAQLMALQSNIAEMFKPCKICSIRLLAYMEFKRIIAPPDTTWPDGSLPDNKSLALDASSNPYAQPADEESWRDDQDDWLPDLVNDYESMEEGRDVYKKGFNQLMNVYGSCGDCRDRLNDFRRECMLAPGQTTFQPCKACLGPGFLEMRPPDKDFCSFFGVGINTPDGFRPLTGETGEEDGRTNQDKKSSGPHIANRYEPPSYIVDSSHARDLEGMFSGPNFGQFIKHLALPHTLHRRASAPGSVHYKDTKEEFTDEKHADGLHRVDLYGRRPYHGRLVKKFASRTRKSVLTWSLVVALLLIVGSLYRVNTCVKGQLDPEAPNWMDKKGGKME
ncbi:MAG: hypothetical protein Q9220_003904 [cf. Caloplaca sp. 1 TL-2023]